MGDTWKPAAGLRETSVEISGGYYSKAYVQKQGVEDKCKAWCYVPSPSAWMPEFLEIAFDEAGKLVWRFAGDGQKIQQEQFPTSAGVFVSHNQGEFGGTLITPAQNCLSGNFVEVFECLGKIYAIDSCNHMGMGHVKIYEFLDGLRYQELFSSVTHIQEKTAELFASLKALYINSETAYILASGYVNYRLLKPGDVYEDKSYLFEISQNGFACRAKFNRNFEWVKNMVVAHGKMILGMDKVVAVVNLDTGEVAAYTPIDREAEEDILKVKNAPV